MRIKTVKIKNYRSIVDCEFEFTNLLALIGENNAGKSNIIYALNLFFNKNKPDSVYDFFKRSQPIEIVVSFCDLTEYEKGEIVEKHRTDDIFVLKKAYVYNTEDDSIEPIITSIKDEEETNIPPRGPQNVLADTLPEFYLLPAVKDSSQEAKVVTTTNFGKFVNLVFGSSEEEFIQLDKLLTDLKTELEREDEDAPLVKAAAEVGEILKEQFQETSISLTPKPINRSDILKSLNVFVDDGHCSPLTHAGHGIQRAFIFATLRLWARKINNQRPEKGKEKKDTVIAIEEPELYLHPHQQKIVYLVLKELSQQSEEQIQIIYSTHSSFMVHIEDYQFIGLVRKNNVSVGTKVAQCTQEIFPPESKRELQLLCQFDPERNEMFFAKKIILVEGDTEKVSAPILLNKLGRDIVSNGISIVECGGKGGIKLFMLVLNAFNNTEKVLDYIVLHDKDIPPAEFSSEEERLKLEEEARQLNSEIERLANDNPLFVFNPDFERKLELSLAKDNKPYRARKALTDYTTEQIPQDLKDFIADNL